MIDSRSTEGDKARETVAALARGEAATFLSGLSDSCELSVIGKSLRIAPCVGREAIGRCLRQFELQGDLNIVLRSGPLQAIEVVGGKSNYSLLTESAQGRVQRISLYVDTRYYRERVKRG